MARAIRSGDLRALRVGFGNRRLQENQAHVDELTSCGLAARGRQGVTSCAEGLNCLGAETDRVIVRRVATESGCQDAVEVNLGFLVVVTGQPKVVANLSASGWELDLAAEPDPRLVPEGSHPRAGGSGGAKTPWAEVPGLVVEFRFRPILWRRFGGGAPDCPLFGADSPHLHQNPGELRS